MLKIRAIIVDDESLARERVRGLLRDERNVEIVAECANGAEAVEQISVHHPDLLFLDIQMPEIDGFEVLRRLTSAAMPVVIFTTAFDQHAVRAFDAHALDYLLKPLKPVRFKEALLRAQAQISNREVGNSARRVLEMLAHAAPAAITRLTIKTDDKIVVVPVGDIDSIESAGNYVTVYVGRETHILRESLKNLETRLPKAFFRVSRAAVVNLAQVKELQPMFHGESVVILNNGRAIPVSRSFRDIQERLESH